MCAAKPEVKVNIHGDEVVDNYSWLKDRENPEGSWFCSNQDIEERINVVRFET